MFDDKNLSPEIIQLFQKAATSPLYFAESLLIDPFLDQPFKATYPQRIIFGSKKKTTYIAAHRRSGKAQPLDSLVYTTKGPQKMRDIQLGDVVVTPGGETASVIALHPQGFKDVYRITLSDHTTVDCSGDHLWKVYTPTNWKSIPGIKGSQRQQYGYRILTTEEIQNNLIYSYSNRKEFNYKLDGIVPVAYQEKILPVDPYLFGVLLGDGHFKTREIVSMDEQIIHTIISRTGFEIKETLIKDCKAKRYKVLSEDLRLTLKEMGFENLVRKEKYIPELYKYASVEQRLWLLRGLMDTDGSSDPNKPGCAEYCSVCPTLANDTADLARSLGCKVTISESEAAYTKNGIRIVTGTRFRLYISQPEGMDIFNLERKKIEGLPERYLRRTIVKVEKLEEQAEMQCITIDHLDHLYLTDHYIPTHNCISGESEIVNSDTLRPSFIKNAQKEVQTLTFDFAKNELVWAPCEWILSGEKECTYYGLETGVGLTLTSNHELFERTKGWIKAKYVKIGDQILAPKEIPVFGDKTLTLDELDQAWQETLIENRVPDVVFQLNKETLIKYLGTVYGEVGTTHRRDQKIVLSLKSSLLKDFHHLFLRLGIAPRIEAYNNVLTIDDKIDYNTFLCYLGIQEEILDVHGPRRWERVVDIIPVGKRKVYDLSVEHEDHNFLANDTIVHNSYSLSILAIWHALVKANQKIVIFAPSSNQVDLVFDNIDAWFFKNPIIEAMQAKEGNHKTPQRRTFQNGSMITGFPLGVAGGLEKGKRGITADVTLCLPFTERVLTDEGWLPIGEIVENNKATKVLSFNKETNETEWKSITRRIKNRIEDKKLVKLDTPFGSLHLTEDHRVFTINGFKKAKELKYNDKLFIERSSTDLKRISNNFGGLVRRCIMLNASQGEQECKDQLQARTQTRSLLQLEVSKIEEVVPFSSQESNKCWLWRIFNSSSVWLSSTIHQISRIILQDWKEGHNSGDFKSSRTRSFGNLVCRRRKFFQESYGTTYRRVFTDRKRINSCPPKKDVKWESYSQKIKNLSSNSNSRNCSQTFNRNYSTLFSRIFGIQNRLRLDYVYPQNMPILFNGIFAERINLESRSSLSNVQEETFSIIQSSLGKGQSQEKIEFVYDLTIEDNHNFFAEGILVHNCDEAQEFGDEDWKVVGPIMRGDRFRMHNMKNYVTGTINKAQGQFYEKINRIIDISDSTESIIKIPITQNKTYTIEEVEQLRAETSPKEWQTEWLLEADESDNSVFRNSDVDACSMEDWEYGPLHITNSEVRFIGVDWDKTQAGTNIAVLQYNTSTRVLKMIYREEVDRSEFTYVNAVNKIVDLYEVFQPELVIADQGGGEVQWELLQLESLKRRNGLANRLIKKAFNEKIDTTNQDGDLERKRIKPFLVGLLQQKVQEHRLQIPRHDKKLIDQFLQYEVKSRTENTVKFSSSNEHIIDCCLFAMYGVWTLYENFLDSFELTAPKNVSSTDFKTPWDQQLLDAQMEQERFFNPSINVPRTSFMDPFPIRSTQDFYRDEF